MILWAHMSTVADPGGGGAFGASAPPAESIVTKILIYLFFLLSGPYVPYCQFCSQHPRD